MPIRCTQGLSAVLRRSGPAGVPLTRAATRLAFPSPWSTTTCRKPQTVTLTIDRKARLADACPAVATLASWTSAASESVARRLRITVKVNQVGHAQAARDRPGRTGQRRHRARDRRRCPIASASRQRSERQPGSARDDGHACRCPATAIEGSVKAFVKLYPSSFSQVVEGLDNIFRMPSGCFEQTSSTTYPNVLALDYLRRNKKSAPKVEAKARQYIHLGYQRLVGFDVPGGGFDWFGNPPANRHADRLWVDGVRGHGARSTMWTPT